MGIVHVYVIERRPDKPYEFDLPRGKNDIINEENCNMLIGTHNGKGKTRERETEGRF